MSEAGLLKIAKARLAHIHPGKSKTIALDRLLMRYGLKRGIKAIPITTWASPWDENYQDNINSYHGLPQSL